MNFKHPKSSLTYSQIENEFNLIIDPNLGFYYFFINYIYMPSVADGGYLSMKENSYQWQKDASKKFTNNPYVIFKKQRQIAASTTTMAYALWRSLFYSNQNIFFVSLTLRESSSMLRKLKIMYDVLPSWCKQDKIEDQKTSITFKHNHSSIKSLPNNQPVRGESASLIILDECAFYKNFDDVLAASIPAIATGQNIINSSTSLKSQCFFISTFPHENIIDNGYIRLLNQARESNDDNYLLIEIDTSDISFYQSEAWHKQQLDILGPRRYAIEIRGEEPIDSDNALLPPHILQTLTAIPPIRCDFLFPDDIDDEGYYKDLNAVTLMKDEFDPDYHYIRGLHIWEDPQQNTDYCVVCDVAKGVGGSASSFHVINLNTMEQSAEFNNDKMDIETYKKVIETVTKFYNNAKLSIENNGLGVGVVQYFSTTLGYPNLYYFKHSKKKYEAGFPMGIKTRGVAISNMQSVISNDAVKIKSIRLINQLRSFGYTNSGKIKGMGQAKDDLVLAFAQFCFLLETGWAVSYSSFVGQQPVAIINMNYEQKEDGDDQQKKEDSLERESTKKYWETNFDSYDIDDKKKELLKMLDAQGLSINPKDLEKYLED